MDIPVSTETQEAAQRGHQGTSGDIGGHGLCHNPRPSYVLERGCLRNPSTVFMPRFLRGWHATVFFLVLSFPSNIFFSCEDLFCLYVWSRERAFSSVYLYWAQVPSGNRLGCSVRHGSQELQEVTCAQI